MGNGFIYSTIQKKGCNICGILPYYGSITTKLLTKPDTLILLFGIRFVVHKVYQKFTDRFYTRLLLAELYKMKYYLTGTIQTNRKGMPLL